MVTTGKSFHLLIGFGLLTCAIWPLIEILFRSGNCIFLTGEDTETTLALLLLPIELAFGIAQLLSVALAGVLRQLDAADLLKPRIACSISTAALPAASPPLALRL